MPRQRAVTLAKRYQTVSFSNRAQLHGPSGPRSDHNQKSTLARVAGARRRRERSPLPVPDSFDSFSSLSHYLMARAAARPSWTSDKGRGTGKGKSSEQR